MTHFTRSTARTNGIATEAARSAESEALRKLAVQSDAGDARAAEILAILAEDPDAPAAAEREGNEVQWFDGCDAVDTGSREFDNGMFNVRKAARWQGEHHIRTATLLDVVPGKRSAVAVPVGLLAQLALFTSGEVLDGPRPDARTMHGQLLADKLAAAESARQTELDKAAFPYLWKPNRKRGSVKSKQGFNAARQRMLDSLA